MTPLETSKPQEEVGDRHGEPWPITTGQIVVISVRIIVPLLMLKQPLAGGFVAMALDGLDVVIVEFFGPGRWFFTSPKLGQEYLHQVAGAQPWDWIKDKLGHT